MGLKQAELKLDVIADNAHIGPWLEGVANRRRHVNTGEAPSMRLAIERAHLIALPAPGAAAPTRARPSRRPVPVESLQHPLSVYERLLEPA